MHSSSPKDFCNIIGHEWPSDAFATSARLELANCHHDKTPKSINIDPG